MGLEKGPTAPKKHNGNLSKYDKEADKDPRSSCCYQGSAFFDALKACISRILFSLCIVFAAWRVVEAYSSIYWLMALFSIPLLIEVMVVLLVKRGHEWKWFSPSIMLFLLPMSACVILLDGKKGETYEQSKLLPNNDTSCSDNDGMFDTDAPFVFHMEEMMAEIVLLCVLLARWLMPKGSMTRDQLSALLLMYIGIASDILDFYNIIGESESLREYPDAITGILIIWAWSLLQFCFSSTARLDDESDFSDEIEEELLDGKIQDTTKPTGFRAKLKLIFKTEVFGVLITMVMQDAPFLVVRLVVIFQYHIFTYTNVFFVFKNIISILLQIYRIVSIYQEYRVQRKLKKEHKREQFVRIMSRDSFKFVHDDYKPRNRISPKT